MNTKRLFTGLFTGTLFGIGLAISGMANPDNVLQFLTLSANWSPALLFVMGAAVAVTLLGYKWVLKRGPLFEPQLHLPTNTTIDKQLLLGAAIFGAGWGFAGFCPGPAITALSSGMVEPLLFVIAMLAGSQLQKLLS